MDFNSVCDLKVSIHIILSITSRNDVIISILWNGLLQGFDRIYCREKDAIFFKGVPKNLHMIKTTTRIEKRYSFTVIQLSLPTTFLFYLTKIFG